MNRAAHTCLPGESILGRLRHIPCPGSVAADDTFGHDFRTDDPDFFRMPDSLERFMLKSDRDFLGRDVQTGKINHDRTREIFRLRFPAGISDERKSR
jgi:hypothetical protein